MLVYNCVVLLFSTRLLFYRSTRRMKISMNLARVCCLNLELFQYIKIYGQVKSFGKTIPMYRTIILFFQTFPHSTNANSFGAATNSKPASASLETLYLHPNAFNLRSLLMTSILTASTCWSCNFLIES